MLTQGLKRNVCWVVIVAMALIVLGNIGTCEAAGRALNINESIKRAVSADKRTVEIEDNILDVYVNRNEKVITVIGTVKDWEEMDKVERHFELRSPADYQVTYKVDIY